MRTEKTITHCPTIVVTTNEAGNVAIESFHDTGSISLPVTLIELDKVSALELARELAKEVLGC